MVRFFCPLLFLLISSFRLFDVGVPSINAVCRIQLKDGTEIEGLICIVSGGYQGFQKNGFVSCYPGNSNFNYFLFNADQFYFNPEFLTMNYQEDRTTGQKIYQQLFYLQTEQGEIQSHESTFNRVSGKVIVSINRKYRYTALKSLYVFQDMEIDLHLPVQNSTKFGAISVKVDEINRFELLNVPSDKWIQQIAVARKKRDAVSQDWQDYVEPLWFHEISKDTMSTSFIRRALGDQRSVITNGGY